MTRAEPIETELCDALWKYLAKLREGRFFGVVELHFSDGRFVRVKEQKVLQPKDLLLIASQ